MKTLLLAALAVVCLRAQEPIQLYAYLRDAAGKWSYQPVVLEGASLDTSKTPAVLKIAPAKVDWSQIINPPVFRFNGPFLESKVEEPVVIDATTGTKQDVTSVSLYLGRLCEAK